MREARTINTPLATLKQKVTIKAAPADVYRTLMDSKEHAKMISASAQISPTVGGEFRMWDGAISGFNVKLVENKKIVQSWRCEMAAWPRGHHSELTFEIAKGPKGTNISLLQTGIPKACLPEINEGWRDNYWTPMKRMLEPKPIIIRTRKVRSVPKVRKPMAKKTKPKAKAKARRAK